MIKKVIKEERELDFILNLFNIRDFLGMRQKSEGLEKIYEGKK